MFTRCQALYFWYVYLFWMWYSLRQLAAVTQPLIIINIIFISGYQKGHKKSIELATIEQQKENCKNERRRRRRRRRRNLLCIGKTNNTNSDVTTSTEVLCRAARIAEAITAGRPTYIKFTQAVNKTTPPPNQPNHRKPKTTGKIQRSF